MKIKSNIDNILVVKNGTSGMPGKSGYIHIKFSDDGGKTLTGNSGEIPGIFMGTYTDNTEEDSNDVSKYAWNKVRGNDGLSPYSVILTNENISFSTNIDKIPLSNQSYTCGIIVYQGTKLRNDFLIKSVSSVQGISISKSTDSITLNTSSTAFLSDSGVIDVVVTIDNQEISKQITWSLSKQGNGISSTETTYQSSSSGTTVPTGDWLSSIPPVNEGNFLWTRTKTSYTNGTISYSYSVSKMGTSGATGQGVSSISEEFYLSSSKTIQTGGSWLTTPPTWVSGKYIWTRRKIIYKNPYDVEYTVPICDSSWEAANNVQTDLDAFKVNNLIANGFGSEKSNYNFSNWTFDGSDSYDGYPSFKHTGKSSELIEIYNKMVPIDTSKSYEFSMNLKADVSEKIQLGWWEYDIDGYFISSHHTAAEADSTTTLAKDLKDGDTVVYLTSASGWKNTSSIYRLGLIFWNYKDSTGYQYPEGVYSRNVWFSLYSTENVNKTDHTITLNTAWTHGTFPAGTKVSQTTSIGSCKWFNYINTTAPTEWAETKWTISGTQSLYAYDSSKFNTATKYIKFALFHNHGSTVENPTTYINSVRLVDNSIFNEIEIGGRNLLLNSGDLTRWEKEGSSVGCVLQSDGYFGITSTTTGATRLGIFQDVPVEPNTDYTFSVWQYGHATTNNGKPSVGYYNNGSDFSYGNPFGELPTDTPVRQVTTVNSRTHQKLRFYLPVQTPTSTGYSSFYRYPKMEKGNKTTDWTPAPEDLQSQIDETISTLSDLVSDTKLTPNEKVIAKKEWLIIADEYPKYITQASGYNVSTTAYTNAYNALNAYLNTTNTGVIFNMNTTTDIDPTVFTNNFKTYYNCKVELTNAITTAKAKYEADNVQVGGRNLAYGTSFSNDPNAVDGYGGNKAIVFNYSGWESGVRNFSGTPWSKMTIDGVRAGEMYTISGWVYIYDDVPVINQNRTTVFYRFANGTGYYVDINFSLDLVGDIRNKWVFVSNTITIPKDVLAKSGSFQIGGYDGHFLVSSVKVERGNKATDWTPAPEDYESKFTEITDTISGVSSKVDATEKSIKDEVWKDSIISVIDENGNTVKKTLESLLVEHNVNLNGISTEVKNVKTTVGEKADGSTVQELSEKQSKLEQDANSFKTTVSNTYATKDEVSSVQSTLIQKDNEIESKVESTEGNVSKLTTNLEGVTADVKNNKGDISRLKTTAEEIRADIKDAQGNITNLQATAKGLETKVSQKQDASITAIRYIRDWLDGNNIDAENRWVECTVMVGDDNIAAGIIPVCKNASLNTVSIPNASVYTDTYLLDDGTPEYYVSQTSKSCLELDLGSIRYDIDSIKIWHYYMDNRVYNHQLQVSKDGLTWVTLYDSKISGGYIESDTGAEYFISDSSISGNFSSVNQTVGKIESTIHDVDGKLTQVTQKVDEWSSTATDNEELLKNLDNKIIQLNSDFAKEKSNAAKNLSDITVKVDGINQRVFKVENDITDISDIRLDANGWKALFAQLDMYDMPNVQTNISIDINGITVTNPLTGQQTKMTIDEFAGYYNDEKIFYLSQDTTMTKRVYCEKGWDTGYIKMTTNAYTLPDGKVIKGVAYVKSGGTS